MIWNSFQSVEPADQNPLPLKQSDILGWMVEIENKEFLLWIGCASYEDGENGFQCFIEPSKPFVRKWFSKIETDPIVEKVASVLESVILQGGKVSNFHWLSDGEARR